MAWRGASASTWLREDWFPSTSVWLEQSWASKLAAKACMAAWLSEAVHREMQAAARDVCKSGGACRASAWASSLTNMEISSLLGVKLTSQPLTEVTLHAKHPSHIWEVIWMPLALAALKFASNWVKPRVTPTNWRESGGIPPCTPNKGSVSSKLVSCQGCSIA